MACVSSNLTIRTFDTGLSGKSGQSFFMAEELEIRYGRTVYGRLYLQSSSGTSLQTFPSEGRAGGGLGLTGASAENT